MTDFLTKLDELREKATPGPYYCGSMESPDGHALAWFGSWFVDTEAPKVNGDRYGDSESDAKLYAHILNHAAEIAELVRAAEEVDRIGIGGHLRLNEALAVLNKEKS